MTGIRLVHCSFLTVWCLLVLLLETRFHSTNNHHFAVLANNFEPYELHGGLLSAVAGRDYVILATDTRLSSGYEILSRRHTTSRIWRVNSQRRSNKRNLIKEDDQDETATAFREGDEGDDYDQATGEKNRLQVIPLHDVTDGAFILSAGCQSDCEALKRQIQVEVRSHGMIWNGGNMRTTQLRHNTIHDSSLSVTSVATLLGQTLYSRRAFPFYSFCIVGGLLNEDEETDNDTSSRTDANTGTSINTDGGDTGGSGVVYVYDAIGSHERVAVAAAGSGKEMLQPILDRLFAVSNLRQQPQQQNQDAAVVDINAIPVQHQRRGVGLLLPPVQTCVDCTVEESITRLLKGYRSVAEREIAVGDEVVMYILRHKKTSKHNGTLETKRFALKKH